MSLLKMSDLEKRYNKFKKERGDKEKIIYFVAETGRVPEITSCDP